MMFKTTGTDKATPEQKSGRDRKGKVKRPSEDVTVLAAY